MDPESLASGQPAANELRVHGVGGAHGARMLGFDESTEVAVVGEGLAGTAVLARRREPSVESYDWGDLTGGSGFRSLWIFLLPFTLLNIAGWMHPPVGRTSQAKVTWIRRLVHALSGLLTATYVLGFGIIVVDIVGWQWARRQALPEDESVYASGGPLPSTLTSQRVGVLLGLAVVAGVLYLLMKLAGKSQFRFEETEPAAEVRTDLTGEERWGEDERLHSRGFFFHPGSARRLLRAHKRVVALTYLLVAAWTAYRAWVVDDPPARLQLSRLLWPCSMAALALILALYVLSWGNGRRPNERWASCGPAIAATLSFALVSAVVSGAILLLLKRLNDWPKRPQAAAAALQPGPEVNLVDVWGFLVLALSAAAFGVWLWTQFRPPADDVKERAAPPGRPLDGVDKGYRKTVAKKRFLADVAHRGGVAALAIASVLLLTALVAVAYRLLVSGSAPSFYLPAPEDLNGLLYRVGTYVLPLLIIVLVQLVRKGTAGARTIASTLWDVLTFWPRRFSPLAVRPYAERAVPELQGRILYQVRRRHPLVVSVHSQGSVLGFAALAPLAAEDLRHVALVTYGSPITTIYATFFPAYFGTDEVEALRVNLPSPGPGLLGWRNFYRRTDPIGGPVFSAAEAAPADSDCELADPFPGDLSSDDEATAPPLEHDRPAWTELAVHSYYLQEPTLKRWVRELRAALGRQASPRGSSLAGPPT